MTSVLKRTKADINKGWQVKTSTFSLKLIALIAMLLDHLEGTFPNTFPVVFGWIGRIAIPLFMFGVVQGLIHTRNRRKYVFRLYIGSVVMSVGNFICQTVFPKAQFQIADNIFALFFLLAVMIALAKSELPLNKKIGLWIGFALIQMASFQLITWLKMVSRSYANLANGLIPNVLTSEGSVIFIVLGIFMYVYRNNRAKFSAVYLGFSFLMLASAGFAGFTAQNLFYGNYQWMMIAALPLMFSYNGERGRSLKYFFYAFYPLHIWILFFIANIAQRK